MRYTDIAIIGGGLSGSIAAAMLGRAGISTVLIDPHESYPPDFRVEKLSGHVQVERFLKTGIAESVLRRATFAGENWIARFGRLLDKAPSRQFNILYDSLVNAVRDEIPATVERICAKALAVETSPERQKITLSNDETISARLVVLANGLNVGLRHQLGIAREVVSACHSISIGFDVVPAGRNSFDFPALTYFSERPSDCIPHWLSSDGMNAAKIAGFYADPVKQACDAWSAAKAFDFRSVSTATSPYWTAQRWARFIAWSAQGLLRPLGGAFDLEPNVLGHSSSSSSSSSSRSSSSSSSPSLSSSA